MSPHDDQMQELNQTIRTCGFESMLSSSVTFINEDLDSLQASHLDMNLDLYHFIEYNGGPSLSPNYEEHMAIFKRVRKKKIYIYIFFYSILTKYVLIILPLNIHFFHPTYSSNYCSYFIPME